MGGSTHGQSMYDQVDDTEPKATVLSEQEKAASKTAEEEAAKSKEDQVGGPPSA